MASKRLIVAGAAAAVLASWIAEPGEVHASTGGQLLPCEQLRETRPIVEDDDCIDSRGLVVPAWDCATDGDRVCGPSNTSGKPAACYDEGGVIVALWPCHVVVDSNGDGAVFDGPPLHLPGTGPLADFYDQVVYDTGYAN